MARKNTLVFADIILPQVSGRDLFRKYLPDEDYPAICDEENIYVLYGSPDYDRVAKEDIDDSRYWFVAAMIKRNGRHLIYAKFYPKDKERKAWRQFSKISNTHELPVYRSQR